MPYEKRHYERTSCQIESSFRPLDSEGPRPSSDTTVQDISEGGIRFRANRFISVHERLFFRINIPQHKTLEVVAQPAWIRELPSVSQYDIGARFLSLSEEDRQIIRQVAQGVSFEV